MNTTTILRRTGLALAAFLVLTACATTARAQAPDFDAVTWKPLACAAGDPAGDESPSAVDLVGDAAHRAVVYAHDDAYLYVRFRVDGNPGTTGHFVNYTWNLLMQVPSGNPFQYQYELSLNGKSDTVEIWANTSAKNISFSPLFNDSAETKLFSEPAGTTPLARGMVTGDGSTFGGNPDYFVDVAFPVSAMIDNGVIASAADLDAALFFPATSTDPNNYNKGHLNCAFDPDVTLSIDKSVAPTVVPAGGSTPVSYTIAVRNDGAATARGVVIQDPTLPAYLGTPTVGVASDDPNVVWSVVSTSPLEVRVPNLPATKTVTITLDATATPDCGDNSFVNVATAFATNAPQVQDDATLTVNRVAGGCAPCTADTQCDDGDACTTDTCVAGACTSTVDPSCTPCVADADCADDGNPCTTETCSAGACVRTVDPSCTPCAVDSECDDGNACTTDTCVAGVCTSTVDPSCTACVTDADCADDGDPCTTETCSAGACVRTVDPSCTPCTADSDCDDGDDCTTDACVKGVCIETQIDGCAPNPPEDCTNGIDDDGDGLVDCHDPDCAGFPTCAGVEVCGDCIDNDGDGLTDYDDPDCCGAPTPLVVGRLMLQPMPKKPNAKRLRLRAKSTGFAPETLDPMHADTTVQISDANGLMLCQHIPAVDWTHRHPRVFAFKDKTGQLAGGMKRARFAMKKSGRVPFRAVGQAITLGQTTGHDVHVTIGVGGRCSQMTTDMRVKGRKLLLP